MTIRLYYCIQQDEIIGPDSTTTLADGAGAEATLSQINDGAERSSIDIAAAEARKKLLFPTKNTIISPHVQYDRNLRYFVSLTHRHVRTLLLVYLILQPCN